jgi:hypothetical protein
VAEETEPGTITAAVAAAKAKAEADKKNAALSNPAITEQIQMILALKSIDSKLEEAWQLYLKGDFDGMNAAILQSNFYRNNNSTARARLQAKTSQPGVYADGLDKYRLATRKSLVSSGLKMGNALFEGLAVKAYDSGMSEDQLKQLIVTSGLVTGYGGEVLGDTAALKSYANSFGVGKYLDDKYWAQKSQDLFLGITTTQDIEDEVRNLSASAFPVYADQIKACISVDSLASAYKGAIASILEKDADSITFDNPQLRAALQYVDKDGKPAVKPLWQFERELRMTPEWELTNNARTTVDNLAYKVMSDWGVI